MLGDAAEDEVPDPTQPPRSRGEVLRDRAFALFWSATTVGAFGGAITGIAIQVLIVTILGASAFEIGLLNAIGVVPYLLLGFVVGALMDRWRRKPVLIVAGVGRAVLLALIPLLWMLGVLQIWTLALVILGFGILTLFAESAAQPFLPRIVARPQLVQANARLGQAGTVAETAGPALGGAVITWLGAPFTFLISSVMHVVNAVLIWCIRLDEPRAPAREPGRHLGHDIVEGMRFTYRHRTLAPMAVSVHLWFLGNSITLVAFAPFLLRDLGFDPFAFGLVLAAAGAGGFIGAVLAPRAGTHLGAGYSVIAGRALQVLPWVAVALAPALVDAGVWVIVLVAAAKFVTGFAMGLEDANEMGYRQAAAPDSMQGRLNATIRTVNRVVLLVGSLLGGVLATALGYRTAIWIGAAVFLIAAVFLALSPFRSARHDEHGTV